MRCFFQATHATRVNHVRHAAVYPYTCHALASNGRSLETSSLEHHLSPSSASDGFNLYEHFADLSVGCGRFIVFVLF